MRAGNLRTRVSFQSQATTQGNMGQRTATWTEYASRMASIEPLIGREFDVPSGEHADVTTRIRVRYDPTLSVVKPDDRITDSSDSPQIVYSIVSVINPKERNRELILRCTRVYA